MTGGKRFFRAAGEQIKCQFCGCFLTPCNFKATKDAIEVENRPFLAGFFSVGRVACTFPFFQGWKIKNPTIGIFRQKTPRKGYFLTEQADQSGFSVPEPLGLPVGSVSYPRPVAYF